jgi:PAS domain S-box-containing protein
VVRVALAGRSESTGGFLEVSRDVTLQARTETAVRASEERLARMIDLAPDGVLLLDAAGRINFANRASVLLLGADPVGRTWDDPLWHLDSLEEGRIPGSAIRFEPVRRTGEPAGEVLRRCRPASGSEKILAFQSSPLRDRAGRITGVVTTIQDVTSRGRVQEERQARVRLEELARRQVEAQEAERLRLARELHDELGGVLAGLKACLSRPAVSPQPEEVAYVLEQIDRLLGRVRDLSLDLRPPCLDGQGLLPALVELLDHFIARTGLSVHLEPAGIQERIAPDLETAAYRIVQEALTNVSRHAGASRVTVRVWLDDTALTVQVEDDGRGFDPVSPTGRGIGLIGMRDRAFSLGGEVTVDSARGAGTRVTAEFPLYPGGEPR